MSGSVDQNFSQPAIPYDARPITDFDDPRRSISGYAVKDDGTVLYHDRRRKRWLALCPKIGPGGFRKVRIRIGGDHIKEIGIAMLVLRAFVGPRPMGCEPLHYPDPDPGNNRLDNLRWAPRGSSKAGRLLSGQPPISNKGDDHPFAALREHDIPAIRSLYRAGVGYKEIAEKYEVNGETIRNVLLGKTWGHVIDPLGPISMRRRGAPSSEDSPNARLDWDRVREIREHRRRGVACRKLADMYGMSLVTIREISCGKTWKES